MYVHMATMDFLIGLFSISLITIVLILIIVLINGVKRWYLKLRLPPEAQTAKIKNIISNENTFNELIKKWTNYNNALAFLKLQVVVLASGCLTAIMSQEPVTRGCIYYVFTIFAVIIILLLFMSVLDIFSNIFKVNIKISGLNEKKGFWIYFLYIIIILSFMIPMIILWVYIKSYEGELDWKIWLSLYLVLTIGVYQYIKQILSFFLPVSANGIYSIEELIQEMI